MGSLLQGTALTGLKGVVSVSGRLGAPPRALILILHRVLAQADPLNPAAMHARRFRSLMSTVRRVFRPLPLADVVQGLRSGTLPQRAVCLTFDDGYADNAQVALPILRELGIHATFFIATGYLNGGVMFNDLIDEALRRAPGDRLDLGALGLGAHDLGCAAQRLAAIARIQELVKSRPPADRDDVASELLREVGATRPRDLMMNDEQVKQLVRYGMSVGGHTHNHPILCSVSDEQARDEVMTGKRYLEELTQTEVALFAYPNGRPGVDYDRRHREMLQQCGFSAAVSTGWGVAAAGSDLMQLPRFMPWERRPVRFAARVSRALVTGSVT